MSFKSVDRLPVLVLEPYEELALERWRSQGLPPDTSPEEFLGMAKLVYLPVSFYPLPHFEPRILEEDDDYIVQVDSMGGVVRRRKDAPCTYYGFIDHPIKKRSDWESYKQRFVPNLAERLPADWGEDSIRNLNESENPVGLSLFPFFFRLGFYSMGMERFLTAFSEEPALIMDMFSFWTDFVLALIKPLLSQVRVDCLVLNEDLAFKTSTHIAPDTYAQFWFPFQDRLVELARQQGVPIISVWTAGNVQPILASLLDHGFNATWPLERRACGLDPQTLRKRFGRRLAMGGNIPKEVLVEGPEAIDREIERLMPIIREGGYVPTLDDMVPIEAPFSSFRYLVEKLQAIRL